MSFGLRTRPKIRSLSQATCLRDVNRLRPFEIQRHIPAISHFSTTTISSQNEQSTNEQYIGAGSKRWNETPRGMRAPVSLRYKGNRSNNLYEVNKDPEVLNAVYRKILGENGDNLLSEEVKWLAITHKSFDQGRRGYNDRLAFIGKRIVDLQTSLALLNRTDGTWVDPPDEFEREPFRHPGVDLLPRLTQESKSEVLSLPRIANLAYSLGLLTVVRWRPRHASDLTASGADRVLSQALYAIYGAVALQNGGEVAIRAVRESLLSRLGLNV